MSAYLGIDLGTTFCCVYNWNESKNRLDPIYNSKHKIVTPSYVAFTDKEKLVGDEARDHATFDPENTIFDSKRMIGRKFSDQSVQDDMKYWPFKVHAGDKDSIKIDVKYQGKNYTLTPEEISGAILKHLRQMAINTLNKQCDNVVITIPAYFGNAQRERTMFAATQIAGFKNVKLIDEPSAAAIAYAESLDNHTEAKALIFDFGGGTLDVSIIEISNKKCVVTGSKGKPHFGGQDIDTILVNYFREQFKTKFGVEIDDKTKEGKRIIMDLRRRCEELKIHLSSNQSGPIDIEVKGNVLSGKLTRKQFNKLISNFLEDALQPVKDLLQEKNLDKNLINEIICVGGSSQIPLIKEKLHSFFEKEPRDGTYAEEEVARGAALHCYNINVKGQQEISDALSSDSSRTKISDIDVDNGGRSTGLVLISSDDSSDAPQPTGKLLVKINDDSSSDPKMISKPNFASNTESSSDTFKQPDSKPASRRYPRPRPHREIVLVDKVALPYGIYTAGGRFEEIITRDKKIPATGSKTFSTVEDYQKYADICIYQGESKVALENQFVGTFTIDNLPQKRAGEPSLQIRLSVDTNGILSLDALCDGRKWSHRFESIAAPSEADEQMIRENLRVFNENDDLKYNFDRKNAELQDISGRLSKKLISDKTNVEMKRDINALNEYIDDVSGLNTLDEYREEIPKMERKIAELRKKYPDV